MKVLHVKKQRLLAFALAVVLAGCGTSGDDVPSFSVSEETAGTVADPLSQVDTTAMFSDRDWQTEYDQAACISIFLQGNTASCDAAGVEISGSTVTITQEGIYRLSGTLEDGMILIDADETDKIQLILDGVEIHCSTSASIYVRQADKVFLTTARGTQNTLSNGGSYEAIDNSNIDAVIFSKSDLTLNGTGNMTVQAQAGHGVVSKDDLVVTSGSYSITAEGHGLSGKDSVRLGGGEYTIVSGKDGVHAQNDDDSARGFLYIQGGSFSIIADGDGLSAGSDLLIADGTFVVTTGGGSGTAQRSTTAEGWWGPDSVGATSDTISAKGIKADGTLTIQAGSFVIDAADDAIHAGGSIDISGGDFSLATGDDGIHGDNTVTISGGSVHVTTSYEGIEGLTVDIQGGAISLVSSDDGINAAGGRDGSGFGGWGGDGFSADEGCAILISGGVVSVNAAGDGLDSNGDLTVTGGQVFISGPTDSGNGALDYNGTATITGGTVVAAGSAGMAQNFGATSTQGSMLVNLDGSAGTVVTLADSTGTTLLTWTAEKGFATVVISCPDIRQGETYIVSAGDRSVTVTMDTLIYSASAAGEGFGRTMGGGRGPASDGESPAQRAPERNGEIPVA